MIPKAVVRFIRLQSVLARARISSEGSMDVESCFQAHVIDLGIQFIKGLRFEGHHYLLFIINPIAFGK